MAATAACEQPGDLVGVSDSEADKCSGFARARSAKANFPFFLAGTMHAVR